MIARKDLAGFADQALWIADDRMAACVSQRSAGIEQIDFHGAQPVSRNARLLQHPDGVLRFAIVIEHGDQRENIPILWQNLAILPATIEASQKVGGLRVKLYLSVKKHRLQAYCLCENDIKENNTTSLRLQVSWNKGSMTTEVHGQRAWQCEVQRQQNVVRLRATDRIVLREWLRRSGDYQGDFLIPEGWRRIIYKRRCVSGTARFEDVIEAYRDSDLRLYEADTWITLGGHGFELQEEDEGWLHFQTPATPVKDGAWQSPIFSLSFSTTLPQPSETAASKSDDHAQQAQRYQNLWSNSPALAMPAFPALAEYFQRVPGIVTSARIEEFGMTRACQGSYYWIWAWDNMVTALAQTHWGDLTNLRRAVDFLRLHRDLEGGIPMRWTRQLEPLDGGRLGVLDYLFSELVMALYRETSDRSVLRTNYPALHHAFAQLTARCDQNGLFASLGMYPDLPHKLGRTAESVVAMEIGAWYCFNRNLEKFAWLLDDRLTAEQARSNASKIQHRFLPSFWDQQSGFFCDSVHGESGDRLDSYPLYSLLFLESPFGLALIREQLKAASSFIASQLLGQTGLAMTASWDRNRRTESAMSAWYPYWDWPAVQILAHARNSEALNRWLQLANECYGALGYCPEFLSLDVPGEERWQHHGAVWNLNCAAGWYNALIRSVAGIMFDLGGMTCGAAAGMPEFTLENLHFRNGRWRVERTGDGPFITELLVDDEPVKGTLKIPWRYYSSGEHRLRIVYGEQKTSLPLLRELWGAAVLDSEVKAHEVACRIDGVGTTDVAVSGPANLTIRLDGQPQQLKWDAETNCAHAQLFLSGEHELVIKTE